MKLLGCCGIGSDCIGTEETVQVAFVLPRHDDRIDILAHELINNCDRISLSGTSRYDKRCNDTHVEVEMQNVKTVSKECNDCSRVGFQKERNMEILKMTIMNELKHYVSRCALFKYLPLSTLD